MTLVACALCAVLLAVPGTASAGRPRFPCGVAKRADATVLASSPDGVVFERHFTVYACLFHVGKVRPLPFAPDDGVARGPGYEPQPFLAGRFIAYVTTRTEEYEPTLDTVRVFDARTGRLTVTAQANSGILPGGQLVWSLIAKRNGSVAWIATGGGGNRGESPSNIEVHAIGRRARDRILDSSPWDSDPSSIQLRSLVLGSGGHSVEWMTNAGQLRTARFN